MESRPLALRLDDVGASSKLWNMHSSWSAGSGRLRVSGNWLFLKALPGLRGWGPYREMRDEEWRRAFDILARHDARMTVAVTASWVTWGGTLIPFPERFPDEARVLREGVQAGLIEIACHGLTHCVLKDKAFRPRWFASNRHCHREFVSFLPVEVHRDQMARARVILDEYLGAPVRVLVPPGDEFEPGTIEAARELGFTAMTGAARSGLRDGMRFVGGDDSLVLHDRDLVLHGVGYLERLIERAGRPCQTVSAVAGLVA